MNLDDFNKSLTGLVEEREKDTNKKDKNQFMSWQNIIWTNCCSRTWKTI
jgi:hypothetical protein